MVATAGPLPVVPVGEDGDVLPGAEDTGAAEGVEELSVLPGWGQEAGPWTGEAGEE